MAEQEKYWNGLSSTAKADLIDAMAFTLTNGDDQNMRVSNVAREVMRRHGLAEDKIEACLSEITAALRML